ncbi:MAG: antibiotic biosynthesis monooxygenase [Bacteroidetes bacterium]|nr:antibiotic biosynthesis monooxygenase [Bacteroidota bacterium]
MFIRIVKMEFVPEKVPDFLAVFAEAAPQIRNFPGCERLELLQDRLHPNVLFTYSYWDHSDSLEAYRKSDLFLSTWARTKIHFCAAPQAWSVNQHTVLP